MVFRGFYESGVAIRVMGSLSFLTQMKMACQPVGLFNNLEY